ncbi:membrane protein insertion efficiency factor YidD [Ferrovibrio sp.]|jgi:putative membrane protein insertion efficiency factor|uniref:membrane protein insertion efficiency factor YidD n=1 Tax=Ferrovibrio sp. TaxID=1917215 RepID=UPI0035B3F389
MTPFARLLSLPIKAYRLILSPWIGHGCRYQPTCSCYALEALEKHGAARGSYLAVRRLARCHPFGGSGYDPVPPAHNDTSSIKNSSVQQGSV